MEPITKSLGHTLRERRQKLRLSQAKVAELTGKTQSQIARLEQGLGEPSFSSVVEVARSLGMELVAVPIRVLPAVRTLIKADSHSARRPDSESRGKDRANRVESTRFKDAYQTGVSALQKDTPRRLVGNDPDDAPRKDERDWPLEDE